MQTDRRTANFDRDDMALIFERVSNSFDATSLISVLTFNSYTKRYHAGMRLTVFNLSVSNVVLLILSDHSSSILNLLSALTTATREFALALRDPKSILRCQMMSFGNLHSTRSFDA
jgi:hypothetical protein